jgi:hypothetical protein
MAQRPPGDPRERSSRPAEADPPKPAAGTSELMPPAGSDAASAQSATAEDQNEQAAAQAIPQPGAVGSIVYNYTTTYIGVQANSIVDSTVTGTGQDALSGLFRASSRDGAIIWQVRPETLTHINDVHVPAPSFAKAAAILRRHHVVVLYGRAHWGKASMAFRLLSDLHQQDSVYVIAPSVDRKLSSLTDPDILGKDGYLIDTLERDLAGQLALPVLSQLAAHLREADRDGHLIITVDGLAPLRTTDIADYLVSCEQLPDPKKVLRRHLREQLDGPRIRPALRVARTDWGRARLRNRPSPPRVRDLAVALANAALSHTGLGAVDAALIAARQEYERRSLQYVNEWFEHHPATRERCFMLAVAVLNGASFEDIADAAERLQRHMYASLPVDERAGLADPKVAWPLQSSRRRRAQDASATLVTKATTTDAEDGPDEIVELEDPLLQSLVLINVWHEHNDILIPMLNWLSELGRDPSYRFGVSGRAAAAAGKLCTTALPFLRDRIIRPWAIDTSLLRTGRISAAIALMVAVYEPALTQQVLRLLRQWTEPKVHPGLPWTAATTYGLLGSEQFLEEALGGLRRVTENHYFLHWVVARSIANLCETGNARAAVDALLSWINKGSDPLSDRALRVFDALTRLRTDPTPSSSDPTIPVLLQQATRQREARIAVLKLWHHLLEEQRTFDKTVEALHRWMVMVDDDERRRPALDLLLHPLLKTPESRPRARSALRRCAFHPTKPSSTATAYYRTDRSASEAVVDAFNVISSRLRPASPAISRGR